jgi:hypothetical protein
MVTRELLEDEDPLSAGSPPFVPEPGASPTPTAVVPPRAGGLPTAGGQASLRRRSPRLGAGEPCTGPARRSLRWSSSLPPPRQTPPGPSGEASCYSPPPPRLLCCGEEVTTARGRSRGSPGQSSVMLQSLFKDVAIGVSKCLHECTRSCCNRFLEMFPSLSSYVCICVRVAVHDIIVRVCNCFLLSQLLFTDVVLVGYRSCIGFCIDVCMRCNRFSFMLQIVTHILHPSS